MVVNKHQTDSYIHRNASDQYCFQLMFMTFGLGTGIGSNRPSSFPAYLAGNLGVGGLLFFLFLSVIPIFIAKVNLDKSLAMYKNQYLCAYISNLAAMFVSIPDLAWNYLWVFLALLMSSVVESKSQNISKFSVDLRLELKDEMIAK